MDSVIVRRKTDPALAVVGIMEHAIRSGEFADAPQERIGEPAADSFGFEVFEVNRHRANRVDVGAVDVDAREQAEHGFDPVLIHDEIAEAMRDEDVADFSETLGDVRMMTD